MNGSRDGGVNASRNSEQPAAGSPIPYNELPATEQWDLYLQTQFVKAWNARQPIPTRTVKKRKAAGLPSWELERRRGYVT